MIRECFDESFGPKQMDRLIRHFQTEGFTGSEAQGATQKLDGFVASTFDPPDALYPVTS